MEVGDETGQDAVLRFVSREPIAEPTARYCDMCNGELDRRQAPPKVAEFLAKMHRKGVAVAAARLSLIQRLQEFVAVYGSKTGGGDFNFALTLNKIEPLRIALDEFDRVSALKISSLREPAATDELQCGHVSFDGSVCPKRLGHFGEHGYPEPAEPSRVEPESEPVRYKLIECARRLRKEQKRVADEGLTQSADEIAAVAFHIDEAAIALKRAPSPAPRWSITDAQMQVGDNLRPAPVGTQEDSPGRALDEEGYPIEPGGLPPGGVDLAKLKVWNAARAPVGTQGEPREGCHCFACDPNQQWRMILCARCGNKRCPHATDHRNSCTGSNEAGQPGSRYRARRIPPTSDPENPAREALKRALRALYVEGVQGGVEHAMDVARDRCAATAEMIAGSRGYARKEAADFFDAEWPAVGERCDWPALADVLAMLEAKPEQERAESNALDREKLRERIAELRGWADETNARWVKRYDVLALLDGAPGL